MSTKFSIYQEPGFYLDRDKATLPRIAGIYVVYRCNYDSFMDVVDVKEVLYIGESLNINKRHNGTTDFPTQHEHYKDFIDRAGGVDHVCYAIIPMEEYSDEERKWIKDAMLFSQKLDINSAEEKFYYYHPSIDLSLNGFPNCWNTHRIHISIGPYNEENDLRECH